MAKFEVEMEITGFKLKMRGEKETVGEIGAALRAQMAATFLPPMITPNDSGPAMPAEDNGPKTIEAKVGTRKSQRRRPAPSGDGESTVIEFQHNPTQYANPVQTWRPYEKVMWLMYVMIKQTNQTHFSPTEISETFARYFAKAGTLRPSNVSRDLSSQKSANPPLVSQDAKTGKYGLFDAGEKHVETLIKTALMPK